jgi:hypothetical protein
LALCTLYCCPIYALLGAHALVKINSDTEPYLAGSGGKAGGQRSLSLGSFHRSGKNRRDEGDELPRSAHLCLSLVTSLPGDRSSPDCHKCVSGARDQGNRNA